MKGGWQAGRLSDAGDDDSRKQWGFYWLPDVCRDRPEDGTQRSGAENWSMEAARFTWRASAPPRHSSFNRWKAL